MKNLFNRFQDVISSTNGKINGHPYASKHFIKSWAYYLLLYIKVRAFSSVLKYHWISGLKIIVDVNDWTFARNIFLRLNEFDHSCFAVHFMKKDEIFVDVGANLGHYSLLVSAISGAKVFAYEPMPDTYKKLIRNIKINRLERLICAYNVGIGSTYGKLSLKIMRNNGHSYISNSISNTVKVEIIPLDTVLIDRYPTMIKIDVEGFEYKVLQGAKNILKNKSLKAILIEINHHCQRYGDNIENTFNYITNLGFKAYNYEPINRKLNKIDLYNRKTENIIFLRNEVSAGNRLKEGKDIVFDRSYIV